MGNKNDIFTKRNNCGRKCGSSEFLVTDNLLGEYQYKSETEKAIARDNLGITSDGTFENIEGNPLSNERLENVIEDSRTVVKAGDGINVSSSEKKADSGVMTLTYTVSIGDTDFLTEDSEVISDIKDDIESNHEAIEDIDDDMSDIDDTLNGETSVDKASGEYIVVNNLTFSYTCDDFSEFHKYNGTDGLMVEGSTCRYVNGIVKAEYDIVKNGEIYQEGLVDSVSFAEMPCNGSSMYIYLTNANLRFDVHRVTFDGLYININRIEFIKKNINGDDIVVSKLTLGLPNSSITLGMVDERVGGDTNAKSLTDTMKLTIANGGSAGLSLYPDDTWAYDGKTYTNGQFIKGYTVDSGEKETFILSTNNEGTEQWILDGTTSVKLEAVGGDARAEAAARSLNETIDALSHTNAYKLADMSFDNIKIVISGQTDIMATVDSCEAKVKGADGIYRTVSFDAVSGTANQSGNIALVLSKAGIEYGTLHLRACSYDDDGDAYNIRSVLFVPENSESGETRSYQFEAMTFVSDADVNLYVFEVAPCVNTLIIFNGSDNTSLFFNVSVGESYTIARDTEIEDGGYGIITKQEISARNTATTGDKYYWYRTDANELNISESELIQDLTDIIDSYLG